MFVISHLYKMMPMRDVTLKAVVLGHLTLYMFRLVQRYVRQL